MVIENRHDLILIASAELAATTAQDQDALPASITMAPPTAQQVIDPTHPMLSSRSTASSLSSLLMHASTRGVDPLLLTPLAIHPSLAGQRCSNPNGVEAPFVSGGWSYSCGPHQHGGSYQAF